ncbi:hypothetical protein P153DRAFT_54726 [Dothidotthia symphoricarpi CBS 119687]|uniref:Uncharacterized protein n=1 Tax=Dothidotthia symphoricarpi CBS 119687 TaxID=1392245 RepID=A0A6A6AA55_9PLEO|nr:uncharacterized protein P153DRAFT_54726 [Dothidotthia symphoricarpi CBS 119687]KAF2127748.1 hypothetical protein P153DRAFT_54726 [Dothidotthia symphoricarpi CBS 119687]
MPSIAHLQKRVDLEQGGLTGTAWALIICVSIAPAIILLGTTLYLLLVYPYASRSCCCGRKKNKAAQSADMLQQPENNNPDNLWNNYSYTIPQRPATTPKAAEPGHSTELGGGRLTKSRPATAKHDMRMSTQSSQSFNTVQGVHEPKPFV